MLKLPVHVILKAIGLFMFVGMAIESYLNWEYRLFIPIVIVFVGLFFESHEKTAGDGKEE